MSRRRVVVTGLGACTALGLSFEKTWTRLLGGENGVGPIPDRYFDASDYRTRIAATVEPYEVADHFDPREAKKLDYVTQYALIASKDCFEDAGLEVGAFDPERVGCILGTGIGGIMAIEAEHHVLLGRGPRRVSPHFIPKMMPNAVSARVSIQYGLQGTNYATSSACASAAHALGLALRTIQWGEADVVVSGGAEAAVSTLSIAAFGSMKALSARNDEPELACRPFDKDRDGFVMGDGAGILMLEEREHALKRGAKIYAEFLGFGSSSDAFHITQPKEDGIGPRRAIEMALKDGDRSTDTIDYVNAHGTSTYYNDRVETKALHDVFGGHAGKLAISSTKSMVGHLLGASAGVEAAATVRSIADGIVHPTRNHVEPGEGCDLDYVPGEARRMPIRGAISNSLGFGGHNVCLLFGEHAD